MRRSLSRHRKDPDEGEIHYRSRRTRSPYANTERSRANDEIRVPEKHQPAKSLHDDDTSKQAPSQTAAIGGTEDQAASVSSTGTAQGLRGPIDTLTIESSKQQPCLEKDVNQELSPFLDYLLDQLEKKDEERPSDIVSENGDDHELMAQSGQVTAGRLLGKLDSSNREKLGIIREACALSVTMHDIRSAVKLNEIGPRYAASTPRNSIIRLTCIWVSASWLFFLDPGWRK